MINKPINKNHIEGYVYEHDLKLKVTGPNTKAPGTQFINGELKVATDEACTNIISVFLLIDMLANSLNVIKFVIPKYLYTLSWWGILLYIGLL